MAFVIPTDVTVGSVLTASRYNADVVANMTAIGGAWTTYTPSFSNLTKGNGTSEAAYMQAGKFVTVRFTFTLGSTSSVGTIPTISVPETMDTQYLSSFALGTCHLYDLNTDQVYPGLVIPSTDRNSARPFAINTSGSLASYAIVNATTPFTWATGDQMTMTFTYEAA
jgi:hypothetical protein